MGSHNNLFSLLCLFLVLLLSGQSGICLQREQVNEFHPTKLFVFGDSYVDTGNTEAIEPYGITFPGKPAGRWSDGRVLTDYIGKCRDSGYDSWQPGLRRYLGLKSPVPYKYLSKLMTRSLKYGMNFAFGGSGVFDTKVPVPNMTIQIDYFEQVIKDKVYNASDLSNSVAYVSVAGNDYFHYFDTNRPIKVFPLYILVVVNQALKNLDRIQKLGVKKIVVGGLQPLGCLPAITAPSSFQECNSTVNDIVAIHNAALIDGVAELNEAISTDKTTFQILDLYDSFTSVLNDPSKYNIQNPLTPCCAGVSSEYQCGSVDESGGKKYTVCDEPKSAFFMDVFHPTQAGWHAVYNKLKRKSVLDQLLY